MKIQKRYSGLYIHIPFCKKKCDYCDFYSEENSEKLIPDYVDALVIEAEKYRGFEIDTLYIGGGTPSLLGENISNLVSKLKKIFQFKLVEATTEVNPESASDTFLEQARASGINRISIGIQSLNDEELKSVGRLHNSKQALEVFSKIKELDFERISTDVMIGLPGQNWNSLEKTLSKLVEMGAGQISTYLLSIEEGTPLFRNIPENLPTNDKQAELFLKTKYFLEDKNFIHVEISNFSKPGQEPVHNLNCWRGHGYIGLGAGASSYIDGVRFKNKNNVRDYIQNPVNQKIVEETLTKKEQATDEAMLRLRMLNEGLNMNEMKSKYSGEIIDEIRKRVTKLFESNLIIMKNENTFLIPENGILTSNRVFEGMMADE